MWVGAILILGFICIVIQCMGFWGHLMRFSWYFRIFDDILRSLKGIFAIFWVFLLFLNF